MTYAAFRTSRKKYTVRPPASCKAARWAWDLLVEDSPIRSLGLIDGLWMCERKNGETDAVGAQEARWATTTQERVII